jgi:L-threonylcarbamoyladenylate synthase
MNTRIVAVNSEYPEADVIAEAAALIRAGETVAFPTETVYGLGANALNADAVRKIFAAKGRPANDPLIVHIAAPEHIVQVASDVPESARALMAAFFPGALTLVLRRAAGIPDAVTAGLDTVGVRMPSHPVAQALIAAAGVPIAAPSANRFAHTSPTYAQHVHADLAGRIPLILDGGSTPVGVESTIVDLSGETPRLLRPGGVPLEQLESVIGQIEIVHRNAHVSDADALPAPGMLLRHYAPRAELHVIRGEDGAVRESLRQRIAVVRGEGRTVGLLIADEDQVEMPPDVPCVSLGSLADLDGIARRLYAGLREIDALNVDVILARGYPQTGIGLAIGDRLTRAAEGRVIMV